MSRGWLLPMWGAILGYDIWESIGNAENFSRVLGFSCAGLALGMLIWQAIELAKDRRKP